MTMANLVDVLSETSVRAAVIAALVAIALAVFRVKASGIRHAAWTSVLAAMLMLPLVSGWLPTVPLPTWMMPTLGDGAQVNLRVVAEPSTLAAEPFRGTTTFAPAPVPAAGITSASRTPIADTPSSGVRSWSWLDGAFVIWLTIAAILLVREAGGWWLARRLAQQGVRVADEPAGAYQSALVATPVVVGVLAPRVLVPDSWPRWSADERQMVVLHERAHVTRRDPLVASLARVNRAVFWFHPLSWWLERRLGVLAERACDEAVVGQFPDARRYAELLVEMATRLHQRGHRVAWHGIGMVSGGRLEDRVDRVLRGPAIQPSRHVRLALTVACALLVAAGASCGAAAEPLAEDPVVSKQIADARGGLAQAESAYNVTADQLRRQKAIVDANPADMVATRRLVEMYRYGGHRAIGWDRTVSEQRAYVLALIAKNPESANESWALTQAQDSEGYAQARALWLAHSKRPGVTSATLANAAEFFAIEEPALAEELLLKGQERDPDGPPAPASGRQPSRRSWSHRLGSLYGRGILGLRIGGFNNTPSIDSALANGSFARHARVVLDATRDDRMLVAAGNALSLDAMNVRPQVDYRALARTYAERALALRPNRNAQQILTRIDEEVARERMIRLIKTPAQEMRDPEFMQLSDELKLKYSNGLLWGPHEEVVKFETLNRFPEAARASLASFERRAHVLLEVAERSPRTRLTSEVMANVHIAFGTIAIRRRKTAEALRHLQQALQLTPPADPTLRPAPWAEFTGSLGSIPAQNLTHALLDAGERETIAAFYEAAAPTLLYKTKDQYLAAAAAIRAGQMPAAYQRELAQQQRRGAMTK
jgi:tetratricopeptide (TPR) repeat protein